MSEPISIGADTSKAEKSVDTLGQQGEKPLQDQIAGAIADEVVRQYIESLNQNQSRVTGQGIDSIQSDHMGVGMYGVLIARYLDAVDEGTNSYNKPPPVKNNTRLQDAARRYGINPYALAQSIAEEGTDAHPFKKKAMDRVETKMDDIIASEVEKTMDNVGEK